MDPASTPWRVLDDQATGESPAAEPAGPAGPARPRIGIPRSAVLAAGGAVVLAVVAFVLAFGSGTGGGVTVAGTVPLSSAADSSDPGLAVVGSVASSAPLLVTEIVGAVNRPGVYRLAAGSRIGDLVDAAGGYGPRVDTNRAGRELNLAAALHDGDQVRVPSRDDPTATADGSVATGGGASTGASSTGGGASPVDLNRATATELDALPGIGPVTAAKIIAAREETPFARVDELRSRKLVGEKTFDNLKDLVTVR